MPFDTAKVNNNFDFNTPAFANNTWVLAISFTSKVRLAVRLTYSTRRQ
jgi:hypothetical protein